MIGMASEFWGLRGEAAPKGLLPALPVLCLCPQPACASLRPAPHRSQGNSRGKVAVSVVPLPLVLAPPDPSSLADG